MLAFVIIVLVATFSSPRYNGNVVSVIDTQYLLNNTDDVKDGYNANIENVPGFFKAIFGNEVIKLSIQMDSGSTKILYIKTHKGKIVNISDNDTTIHTLEVQTNETTVNKILSSNDQIREINKALKEGLISYKAVTFRAKVKTKIAGMGYHIWSWFN